MMKRIMARLKGWRTILFNLLSIVVMAMGVVLQYIGELGLTTREQAVCTILLLVFVNIGNMVLRVKTTTPVGRKA